ncbi:uncharacterized protein [Prorops nasuta]|uniref:uncharacterized protein n=1 Tax=Prorops nasuta TaxID=863751 RepID=UPI0034CDA7F4
MSCCGGKCNKGNGAISKRSGGCGCSNSKNCYSESKRIAGQDYPCSSTHSPGLTRSNKGYGYYDERTPRYFYRTEDSVPTNYSGYKGRNHWEDDTATYSGYDGNKDYAYNNNYYYDDTNDASDDEYTQQPVEQGYQTRVGGGRDSPVDNEQDYTNYYYENAPIDDERPSTLKKYNRYSGKYNRHSEDNYGPRRRVHF